VSQPLTQGLVIPAKAGIQLIEKFPHSGSTSRFRPLRGLFVLLDSRFRGITNHLAACCLSEMASSFINDETFGSSAFNDFLRIRRTINVHLNSFDAWFPLCLCVSVVKAS